MKSNANLIHYFIESYYMVPLLLIGCTIYYIYSKILKAGAALLLFPGCALLSMSPIPPAGLKFYLEPQYLILSFYVLCAFVYDVVPFLIQKNLPTSLPPSPSLG